MTRVISHVRDRNSFAPPMIFVGEGAIVICNYGAADSVEMNIVRLCSVSKQFTIDEFRPCGVCNCHHWCAPQQLESPTIINELLFFTLIIRVWLSMQSRTSTGELDSCRNYWLDNCTWTSAVWLDPNPWLHEECLELESTLWCIAVLEWDEKSQCG